MKLRLLILVLFPLLIACGQEETHAVYDTDSNPANFPPEAVELIRQIETGKLVGSEAITQAFGNVLTEHGDLLDRPEWKQTIGNMGNLFRATADSLSRQGIGSYSLAAEYYQLSALAHPEDQASRRMSGLFGSWLAAKADSTFSPEALAGDFKSLDIVVATTRRFISGDTLSQQFFATYLAPEIKKTAAAVGLFDPASLAGRPLSDRDLLARTGLADTSGLGK